MLVELNQLLLSHSIIGPPQYNSTILFKAIFYSNAEILANLIVLHMYILSHYFYVCSHIDFQAGGACKYDVVVLLRRHQSIQILPRQMGKKIAS